ncbi:MAG: alpha/beta hydrolase [Desulforhabdus sp.]|jgi:fermentation-respiration switch protein FrsA (DUF1100 family)|nr:alpha/beta hydrolase [Desulforhabdus sp.]
MSEKGIVFFPDPILEATPRDYGLESYEEVFFPATDGTRLHGWFVEGPDRRAVLVWFHGNAGNISHRLDSLKMMHKRLRIPIFIFDYREYGLSEGSISKAGTFLDAQGAYRYITEQKGFPPSSVILYGRSLGTALAVYIASRKDSLGVVLEAAFTSTDDVMKLYSPYYLPQATGANKYDNLSLIGLVASPVLFIHGQMDHTIPISMAKRLYQETHAPKYFFEVPGADHNDTYLVGGSKYLSVWSQFIKKCLDRKSTAGTITG